MLLLGSTVAYAQTPGQIPVFDQPGTGVCNSAVGGNNNDCIDSGISANSGNIFIPNSTAATGNILKGGALFLHDFGFDNTFLGQDAGNLTMTGTANTASGSRALQNNTIGTVNTAVGVNALRDNTTGTENTAIGGAALRQNIGGSRNTAIGRSALRDNTTLPGVVEGNNNTAIGAFALARNTLGFRNTAIGDSALANNTEGIGNIAIGQAAGDQVTGNDNILIGNPGVGGEGGAIRIGVSFHRFFSAPILNTPLSGTPVVINGAGLLGFQSSSRRFKEDIRDMGEASSALRRLRPVTFYYKQTEQSGPRQLQYGLVAEEVAEVYPELVEYSETGEPFAVRYHLLGPMLLNEVQRQDRQIQEQRRQIHEQAAQIAELKGQAAENADLKARLEKLEGMVRNVAYQTAWSGPTE